MDYQQKKQAIAIAKHKLGLAKTIYSVDATFEICKNKTEALEKMAGLCIPHLIVKEMGYTILIKSK